MKHYAPLPMPVNPLSLVDSHATTGGFKSCLPHRPYCTDDLTNGLKIRDKKNAIECRYIQLNSPNAYRWLAFDIDVPGAYYADQDANLPPANIAVSNPKNGHAHLIYLLTTPIACHNAARLKPLQYLAAVQRGLTNRLGADKNYVGLIAKNPLHAGWRTEWRHPSSYSLDELDDWLFENDKRFEIRLSDSFGLGRNVTTFDAIRALAYREVRKFKKNGKNIEDFRDFLLEAAERVNVQFTVQMTHGEIISIVKSVTKWVWKRFSEEAFGALQSIRGEKSMAARWKGHVPLRRSEPWKRAGCSQTTWWRMTREARSGLISDMVITVIESHPPLNKIRPWESEGISRATWFRRRGKPVVG